MPERALARVSCGAIERNCALLHSKLAGRAELCAVVKADGYGHGAERSARAALAGGATRLAVATAREAAALREAGIGGPLLVMGALTPADLRIALEAGAEVTVWTHALADALPPDARAHVKLDTGMGRLGTKDAQLALELCERVNLAGVMTHFATADERGDEHFPRQIARFTEFVREVKARHPAAVAHAANSAAVLRDTASHFDMVRCGVAIYGLDPFQGDPRAEGLEPALELESYVASVKRFEPGDSAGYGRTWAAREPTDVAVLPIGYGDGWRRGLSNNAEVLIRGHRHPLVGTVSMDNVTVDLGAGTDVEVGDRALLIGRDGGEEILAEEVARRLRTINYEVTCGLTARVARRDA